MNVNRFAALILTVVLAVPAAAYAVPLTDTITNPPPDTRVGEYSPDAGGHCRGDDVSNWGVCYKEYSPDKDNKCRDGDALNIEHKCRDGRVFAHDPCYDGPQNKYDKAACEAQEAAKAEQDRKNAEQLAAAEAAAHRKRMLECDKQPTMLGVLYCRFDNN
jgi:hypothetical protein